MEFITKLIENIKGIFDLSREAINIYPSFPVKKKSRKFMKDYKTYCIDSEYQLRINKIKDFIKLGKYFIIYLLVFLSASIFINSIVIDKLLIVLFRVVPQNILEFIIFIIEQLDYVLVIIFTSCLIYYTYNIYKLSGEYSGTYIFNDKITYNNSLNIVNRKKYINNIFDILSSGVLYSIMFFCFGTFHCFNVLGFKFKIVVIIILFIGLISNAFFLFFRYVNLLKIKPNCLTYVDSLEIKKILVNYSGGSIELDAYIDQLSVRDNGSVYLYYKLDNDLMKSLLLNNVQNIVIGSYIITYDGKWNYSINIYSQL